jgi:hypothetical protein
MVRREQIKHWVGAWVRSVNGIFVPLLPNQFLSSSGGALTHRKKPATLFSYMQIFYFAQVLEDKLSEGWVSDAYQNYS